MVVVVVEVVVLFVLVVTVVVVVVVVGGSSSISSSSRSGSSSSSSKARPQAPGSFLLLEWFCWFFRVSGGWGGGGDVNVHTDAKMKTEQHLEMPTMMTMSMAMMHLMMI